MLRHGVTSHNPFQPIERPWCRFCQDETDVDVEAVHDNARMMYREICRRCKRIGASGVYDNVPVVGQTFHQERSWAGLTTTLGGERT